LEKSAPFKKGLIKSLMESDHVGSGFLSAAIIKDCFAKNKLDGYKPDNAIRPLSKNQQGESNYRQMLNNMFGY